MNCRACFRQSGDVREVEIKEGEFLKAERKVSRSSYAIQQQQQDAYFSFALQFNTPSHTSSHDNIQYDCD